MRTVLHSSFSGGLAQNLSQKQDNTMAVLRSLLMAILISPWLLATSADSQSSRTHVSGLGKDSGPCSANSPCLTLQRAFNQTLPGGQIYALDSANYGSLMINKAVSIIGGRGATGILATANVSGITINAGTNDIIALQGLNIDGAQLGSNGVLFTSGASLHIRDSVIRGFSTGINFHATGASTLLVEKSTITNNGTGINFQTAAATTGVLNDLQAVNNASGITATGGSASAVANLIVQGSIVANNSTVGILAGSFAAVTVSNSTLANNGVALQAQSASAGIQVSGSTVTGNGTGWLTANGGQVISSSGNSFGGNSGGDTAPPTAAFSDPDPVRPDPPRTVAKNIVTDFGARCDGVSDDARAFAKFNTWARTQSLPVQLTIPSGSVCQFISNVGSWWAKGIKQLTVIGYGATIGDNNGAGGGFFLGGVGICPRGLTDPNGCSARLATVAAGANTIQLLDASYSSRFKVGRWAIITGYDLQGLWRAAYGWPPNAHFFEYVQITAVDAATGKITFAAPLKNAYKSTWPSYNSNGIDLGGPATLYALDPSWDTEVEYRGLTIAQPNVQTYAIGRSITYRDVTFKGRFCAVPTQNLIWQGINLNIPDCGMEADKLVGTIALENVTIRQMDFQSSSIDLLTASNSTIGNLNGTPKRAIISNSTINTLKPGAYNYGRSDEFLCTNCVISSVSSGGVIQYGTDGEGVDISYTMNNGVIIAPNTLGALNWAVPGTNLFWSGRYPNELAFQVVDVTQDANNTYVYTTLTGGFPNVPRASNGTLRIRVHPAPKFTCTNCTGSAAVLSASQAPAGAPYGSYAKVTLNRVPKYGDPYVELWGTLSSMNVNVTKPYTGAQSSLTMQLDDGGMNTINPDGTANCNCPGPFYGATFNLRAIGERNITPNAVTGAQTGDLYLTQPQRLWSAQALSPKISMDISGEASLTYPSVTIEVKSDQGVVNP